MRARWLPLAGLLVLALAAPAGANDGEVHGSCSGGPSEFRLRVERDDASLRVRFEIEGGEQGQSWQLFMSDDGKRIYAKTKAAGDEGHVRARILTRDRAGRDRIAATGVNLATGESCAGSVSV
jgi:hypothetical protein